MKFPFKEFIRDKFPYLLTLVRAFETAVKHQQSRIRIRRLVSEGRELFVELGAGNKKGTGGWLTVDTTRDCDIFWDLRYGIPFPDESVTSIYSSHFLEHLTYPENQKLLHECRRVLKPDGTFSVCVPNARLYLEAYLKPDSLSVDRLEYKAAYNNTTKIDFVNYIAYMDGHHKYMFDEENLPHILKSIGFRNARLRQFNSSLDLLERDFGSIYAEAEK